MGLLRLIIFGLVIWLMWRLFQIQKEKKRATRKKSEKIISKNMVKCEYCDTHLPAENAISDNKLWFCNQKHLDSFKK